MKLPAFAGSNTFAHLLGRNAEAKAKRAEDDKDDDKDAKARADDGDDDGDDKDAKAKARAEDDSDDKDKDARAEDGDDDDKKDDDKKSRKAKKARADDGDDNDDDSDARAQGAREMQARCAAIFGSEHAVKNLAQTAQLAFGTNLPAAQCIDILKVGASPAAAPQARRNTLDERMANVKTPAVGASDATPPAGKQGLAAQIVAAGKKARGEA